MENRYPVFTKTQNKDEIITLANELREEAIKLEEENVKLQEEVAKLKKQLANTPSNGSNISDFQLLDRRDNDNVIYDSTKEEYLIDTGILYSISDLESRQVIKDLTKDELNKLIIDNKEELLEWSIKLVEV